MRARLIGGAVFLAWCWAGGCMPGGDGGGGTGGGGASAGGAGGAAARCNATALAKATLEGCPAFPDLPTFEKDFLAPRCGKSTMCHKKGSLFPPVINTVNAWKTLVGAKVNRGKNALCQQDLYINVAAPDDSLMLAKTRGPDPTCPSDGEAAGLRMPNAPEVALDEGELGCLTAYVHAVAANCE